MADPRAMGLALLQQYAPAIPAPKVGAYSPPAIAQQLIKQGTADDWGNDAYGQRPKPPLPTAPGISPIGNAAAQAAAAYYGPVTVDPNNPYAGSQWDPRYGQ